jgi:hypothetical protein
MKRHFVRIGETVRLELPYTEVCMFMRVAGEIFDVQLQGEQYPVAQLYRLDGTPFSFPITPGEAGLFSHHGAKDPARRYYCYPVHADRARICETCGHTASFHVLNPDHARFGDCEHVGGPDLGPMCKCSGFRSKPLPPAAALPPAP